MVAPNPELDLELALAHASVAFRALVPRIGLERDCRWMLSHGWAVHELTIVECRVCRRAWLSPVGSTYPHLCAPIDPDRNFTEIGAAPRSR